MKSPSRSATVEGHKDGITTFKVGVIVGVSLLLALGVLLEGFSISIGTSSGKANIDDNVPSLSISAYHFQPVDNDMQSAVEALTAARTQVNSLEIAERRQHTLFLLNTSTRKDWQQSQSDLANAQSTLRSAEIALGSARNRLRIRGKSEAEIVAFETEKKM